MERPLVHQRQEGEDKRAGAGRETAVLCCAEGRAVARSEGQSRKENVSEDGCLCVLHQTVPSMCVPLRVIVSVVSQCVC